MSASSVLSSEENIVGAIKLVGHVVGIQDRLLRGLQESTSSSHLDEGVRDWQHSSVTVRGSSNSSGRVSFNWHLAVTWNKWSKMLFESDGADSWTTSTMGD
jgi:hypothetical protein